MDTTKGPSTNLKENVDDNEKLKKRVGNSGFSPSLSAAAAAAAAPAAAAPAPAKAPAKAAAKAASNDDDDDDEFSAVFNDKAKILLLPAHLRKMLVSCLTFQ